MLTNASTTEVKQEISKIIESLPESVLTEVLTYLREIEKASKDGGLTAMHLRTILRADHELLQELANENQEGGD